ncbi:MAG TPA: Mpo1-like protein [Rhodocyclaceae bacterium]|nr:Mpo1-like protein [Rhodocyclaceae bacterium]
MRTLADQLVQYAAYHRDDRNIATHFVGIPMIVFAASALLSRPHGFVVDIPCSPAIAMAIAFATFYLSLDLALGAVMSVFMATAAWFGWWSAEQQTYLWLLIGVGGFVVGWAFQLLGHIYEGKKPAFMDDIMGLAIGPLFVLVEVLFKVGLLKSLRTEIEQRAGRVRRRKAMVA